MPVPEVADLKHLLAAFEADREAFHRVVSLLEEHGRRLDEQRGFIEATRRELEHLQENGQVIIDRLRADYEQLKSEDGARRAQFENEIHTALGSACTQAQVAIGQASEALAKQQAQAQADFKRLESELYTRMETLGRGVRADVDGMRGAVATQGQQLTDLNGGLYQVAMPKLRALEEKVEALTRQLAEETTHRKVLESRVGHPNLWMVGLSAFAALAGAMLAMASRIALGR